MSVGPILSWGRGGVKSPARKRAEDARQLVPRILCLPGIAIRRTFQETTRPELVEAVGRLTKRNIVSFMRDL
jgi:hypothetical protein